LLSGILLSLPWYPVYPGVFLVFALVPLFYVENFFLRNKAYFPIHTAYLHFTLTFFIWQLLSFWWISNVTTIGALFLIMFNSLCYATVFVMAHLVGRVLGPRLGRLSLLVFWLSFEYLSLHADFAIPWLVLGNGMADNHKLIQWYEYTGVLGGSLWILYANFLLWDVIFLFRKAHPRRIILKAISLTLLIVLPPLWSHSIYNKVVQDDKKFTVAVIQPNIDPFNEKFSGLSQEEQLSIILHLADSVANDSIDIYVAPETSIDNQIWEENLRNNYCIFTIDEFVHKHTNAAFVIGAVTNKGFLKNETPSVTARYNDLDSLYFDVFNTGMYIDTSTTIQLYHKSKLVPGVERAPFIKVFKFLKNHTLSLGGADGSFGQQAAPSLLENPTKEIRIAPLICYESVFGAHVNDFINKGANVIFILTNDGWWSGTPAYQQHIDYARLRAIETRRTIVQCANTGISGIIDNRGNLTQATRWWQRTAFTATVKTSSAQTFYVKHGDYIGRIAVFLAVCILMILVSTKIRGKK